MDITEVRIKPADDRDPRLLAFAAVTIAGDFVVRDVKVIRTPAGTLTVAMPARRRTDRCPGCGTQNHLAARFCNGCGRQLADGRAVCRRGPPAHPGGPGGGDRRRARRLPRTGHGPRRRGVHGRRLTPFPRRGPPMVMPSPRPGPAPFPRQTTVRTLMAFDPAAGWGHSTYVCDCGCAPTDRPGLLLAGFVAYLARKGFPNPGNLHFQLVAFDGTNLGVLGSWTPDQALAAIAAEAMSAPTTPAKGGAPC